MFARRRSATKTRSSSWWPRVEVGGTKSPSVDGGGNPAPAMISSYVRRRPPSSTDAGLTTRMTVVVSTRLNSVGDASSCLDRPACCSRSPALFFLPFAILGMTLLHLGPAAGRMAAAPEPGCEACGRDAYP